MSLLSTLPPELITHILLLSASFPFPSTDPLTRRLTLRQLHSLSLTCRAFRPLAQRELLRLAHPDGEVLRAYHAKEFGRFCRTILDGTGKRKEEEGLAKLFRKVDVELWGEDVPEELVEVLKACEEKEEVVLACVERVRFEDVAVGENLTALSARQCSFTGPPPPLSPSSSPPRPTLRSLSRRLSASLRRSKSPPLPPLPSPPPLVSTSLRSLSLHLVTLRRSSLPPFPSQTLPNLRELLLFLGSPSSLSSGDQHFPSIRSFLRGVAPEVRALSLDWTAFMHVLQPQLERERQEGAEDGPIEFPNLRVYGLYFDAAHLSLVGSSLFFPSPSSSSSSTTNSTSPTRALLPIPPYLHISLYPSPSALPVFEGLVASLFETEGAVRWAWRGAEEVRFDALVRDLDVDWVGGGGGAAEDEEEGEEDDGERKEQKEGPRLTRLLNLAAAAGIPCTIDPRPPSSSSDEDNDGGRGTEERGTFKRGFETSGWRFVREVEGRG